MRLVKTFLLPISELLKDSYTEFWRRRKYPFDLITVARTDAKGI